MPSSERYTPAHAAEALGIRKKAVENAIQRGKFPNAEHVPNPSKPGRTLRVFIPRADVEAEAARRGLTLSEDTGPPRPDSKRRESPARTSELRVGTHEFRATSGDQQMLWQEAEALLEEIATLWRENLALRVRMRELERERR